MRSSELLGAPDEVRSAQAYATFAKILTHAADVQAAKCVDGDLLATVELRQLARTAYLLGFDAEGEQIEDQSKACVRFEVAFTSTFTHDYSGPTSGGEYTQEDSHLNWSVEADPVVLGPQPHGSGAVKWTAALVQRRVLRVLSRSRGECVLGGRSASTTNSTFRRRLPDAHRPQLLRAVPGEVAPLRGYVRINPGGTSKHYELNHRRASAPCPPRSRTTSGGCTRSSVPTSNSSSVEIPLQSMTFDDAGKASYTFDRAVPGEYSHLHEETVVTFTHVPLP